MPTISTWLPRSLVAFLALVSVLASSAWAQQPPVPKRIRGTIESVDGKTLVVKTRAGINVKVNITDDVAFVIGEKSAIKPGAKIVILGATKKDDGSLETRRIGVGRDSVAPPI